MRGHAGDEKPDDRREVDAVEDDHHDHAEPEQQQQISQEGEFGHETARDEGRGTRDAG